MRLVADVMVQESIERRYVYERQSKGMTRHDPSLPLFNTRQGNKGSRNEFEAAYPTQQQAPFGCLIHLHQLVITLI